MRSFSKLCVRLGSVALLFASTSCVSSVTHAPGTVWATPAGSAPTPIVAPVTPQVPAEPAVQSVDPSVADVAAKLRAAVEGETKGWDRLAYMSDVYGPRLSGSKALEDAIDWTLERMREDGLENVRREEVMVPHWVRGKESLKVIGPRARSLPVIGLGGTVGTGRAGVRGEVVVVDDLAELEKKGEAKELKDKIVVINQAMPPYDYDHHDAHYGATVVIRSAGPAMGGKYGAKAVLIRSVTAHSLSTVHTGATRYPEDAKRKIPGAAITPADTEYFKRMQERGVKVEVELKLGARTKKDAKSGNAIAEIPGREKPEEIVVIGGHIDSWDVGDGSTDDGSGCLMAMEAARMLKALGIQPKRTIRVVLFTNEENGLRGGKAYHAAHGKEVHAGAIESDSGSGAPWGFGIVGSDAQVEVLQRYAPAFAQFGIESIEPGWGGADISPLTKDGVLSLSVRPDTSHYFDLHHSPADTVEKIDPADLQFNAAAMALMAYVLAEIDLPEGNPPQEDEPARMAKPDGDKAEDKAEDKADKK